MSLQTRATHPFRLNPRGPGSVHPSLWSATRPAVERILAFPELNQMYEQIQGWEGDRRHFADKGLDILGVRYGAKRVEVERIPKQGPLVIVSNHPFGGIEGMILCSLLSGIRPDVKFLANYLLSIIPDLQESFFFVDPFEGPKAAATNRAVMRSAIDWVKAGGVLGVFPAGEVSHLNLRQRAICDPPWRNTVGRIVQRTGASVLPIFFDGRNSNFFQVMGMVHPRIRTALLPREMLKKRKTRVRLRIGGLIPAKRTTAFESPDELTTYLRVRTYILKSSPARDRHRRIRRDEAAISTNSPAAKPIIERPAIQTLVDELASLAGDRKLVNNRDMDVYLARHHEFPTVMREIGRMRETSFRQVGEGTGKALDLDRFDEHYLHLIVWHRDRAELVGAYRLGLSDEILPRQGLDGLYTATLFEFKPQLLEQISPAIELGRSFIHPDYQKSFAPLMLLWQALATYIGRQRRYRHIFGTVSISSEYRSMTKQLLMSFLNAHESLPQMSKLLRAKNPPKQRPPRDWDEGQFSTVVRDVNQVNELVADLESDGKTMPVLLRQYLKLNGKLLGFNVDPDFGNVLDGLMLFDLLDMPRPMLGKYMGKASMTEYLRHHGVQEEGPRGQGTKEPRVASQEA